MIFVLHWCSLSVRMSVLFIFQTKLGPISLTPEPSNIPLILTHLIHFQGRTIQHMLSISNYVYVMFTLLSLWPIGHVSARGTHKSIYHPILAYFKVGLSRLPGYLSPVGYCWYPGTKFLWQGYFKATSELYVEIHVGKIKYDISECWYKLGKPRASTTNRNHNNNFF